MTATGEYTSLYDHPRKSLKDPTKVVSEGCLCGATRMETSFTLKYETNSGQLDENGMIVSTGAT